MIEYRLISEPVVDLDVEAAFEWYEKEQAGLGVEFLNELRATYDRIADGPLKCQDLRGGIRHAILKRFPYAVYFAVEGDRRRNLPGLPSRSWGVWSYVRVPADLLNSFEQGFERLPIK